MNTALSADRVSANPIKSAWPLLAVVTVMTGIAAGIGGTLLALLLHTVQHIAYGYSGHKDESFLQGVIGSSPLQRFLVLSVCGLVAGIGWWAVRRFGSHLVSIRSAVNEGERMPPLTTVAHDLLQIITVGLGSPLGREVAPRELGSLLASFISRRAKITPEESRILIACGAGAGLAAVYNAPLGGALFTLEVLLGSFSLSSVVPAIATSAIAAYLAWIGLGDETPYDLVPGLSVNGSLVMWSVVFGPLFGFAARWFTSAAQTARAKAPRDWRLPVWCAIVFPAIGLAATAFPQILGNGKGVASLGFDGSLTIGIAATLLFLRTLATLGSLRAGAEGGLLTPSVAIAAPLAAIAGGLWNRIWPGTPLGSFAIVGGAAFLASSMRMPVTAIVLMIEFTRVGHDFLIPMTLAVAGSIVASQFRRATDFAQDRHASPTGQRFTKHDPVTEEANALTLSQ